MPHCGMRGPVLVNHVVDSTSHQQLGLEPVLLRHIQVPGVYQKRPSPQHLYHELARPYGEEEGSPATAKRMSPKEGGVEASLLEEAGELLVGHEPFLAVREGG